MNANEGYLELALAECCAGEEGEVVEITGDCALSCRLRELGIAAGAWLRVVQPGSPVIIQCGETRLCVRAEQARAIRLRIDPLAFVTPEMAPAANAPRSAL